MSTVYDFSARALLGEERSLAEFRGQVMLIVNTASECGFTPQYEGLEQLYRKHKDNGFVVLGFPCNQFGRQEPGGEEDIQSFCQRNYGVTFPMFAKIEVIGDKTHPLFQYLKEEAPGVMGSKAIKWNFTKFLVDRSGKVVKRYASTTKPEEIENDIVQLLG